MDSPPTTPSATPGADHLCVLVHGLWGNPDHLSYLAASLREKYAEDRLHILVAKRNIGSFTYDGIEVGGERVSHEIEEKLEELARAGHKVKKLSVIGYSLGGLVSRYAIGLLYSKGLFDQIEPVNFTTFATPHLGVRTPLLGYHNHIWNVLGARTLSISGRQLFTIDNFRETGRPLLAVLADPSSIFIKALAKFKNRTLYCNVVNDRSAVYYTTGITRTDPFVDLDNIKINYLPGYEPVILDGENPVSPREPTADDELPSFTQRITGTSSNIVRKIPITAFLVIFIPIGTVIFLINSAVQSLRSRQRIRLHEEGKSGVPITPYRIPLMIDNVRETAEDFFENVNSGQHQEYLPHGCEEMASAPQSPLASRTKSNLSIPQVSEKTRASSEMGDSINQGRELARTQSRSLEFRPLALTADQFAMIQALDDVGFKKFPVHIHKVRHTHAAIIVRMQWRKGFDEGKVVVKHWLGEFEI